MKLQKAVKKFFKNVREKASLYKAWLNGIVILCHKCGRLAWSGTGRYSEKKKKDIWTCHDCGMVEANDPNNKNTIASQAVVTKLR